MLREIRVHDLYVACSLDGEPGSGSELETLEWLQLCAREHSDETTLEQVEQLCRLISTLHLRSFTYVTYSGGSLLLLL